MAVCLYYFPSSFFSKKVRFVLEEKGIPYKKVFINLAGGETSSPWYMKTVNINGVVPTLQHGDLYIPESSDIIKYLDKTFGGEPMYPDANTPRGRKIADFMQLFDELVRVELLSYGPMVYPEFTVDMKAPQFYNKRAAGEIASHSWSKKRIEQMQKCPELREAYAKKVEKTRKFEDNLLNRALIKKCIENNRKFWDEIERMLKANMEDGNQTYFLLGPDFNVADVMLCCALERTRFVGLSKTSWQDGRHPHVESYYERVKQRPSFRCVCGEAYDIRALQRTILMKTVAPVAKRVVVAAGVALLGVAVWKYLAR